MNEQRCKLPALEELKELLLQEKNIVWYMRCPSVEGTSPAKRYLKQQIKKFREKQKEKYGGL